MKNRILVVLVVLAGCSRSGTQTSHRVFYDLCLANRTTNVIHGSYQFSNFTNTVGVIGPWCSATEGFMPTDPNGEVNIVFRDDTGVVASGRFAPAKHFPKELNKSITTTYTLLPDKRIELSFVISLGSGETKTIIPGESESQRLTRERDESFVRTAAWGNPADVPRLLKEGANINARNSFGMSAIMMATSNKRTDLVRYLYGQGANLTFRNGNRQSVFDIANGDEQLLEALKEPQPTAAAAASRGR